MLTLASQSRVQHLLLREALTSQIAHQIVPALRSVSATETLAIGLAEVTTVKQFACGKRVFGHQLRYEKLLCSLIGFQQTGTFRTGMLLLCVRLVITQFNMVFVGQKLDGVAEVDVLLMLNIAEHVTAETATETMPYTQRRAHGKTWRFFIVERAQPYISASSGRLERNRCGHNVIQIGGGANFFDIFLQNHSWHSSPP